jgi:hypothetical protein
MGREAMPPLRRKLYLGLSVAALALPGAGVAATVGAGKVSLPAVRGIVSAALIRPFTSAPAPSTQKTLAASPRKVLNSSPRRTLASPTSLTVTSTTQTSASLSWQKAKSPVAGYRVYLNSVLKTTTTATSYTFASLTCGTSYTLGVAAFDKAGNVSAKRSVVATASPCAASTSSPPPPPSLGTSLPAAIPPSTGTSFYVSPTGSDSNPGTLSAPWRTITHAMAVLTAGQTAYVRAGTYAEGSDSSFYWTTSGTAAAPITIRGYPGETDQVVIKTRVKMQGSYQRLADVVVDRNTYYSNSDGTNTGDVNVWIDGDHDAVEHCDIRNGNMSGVFVTGSYDQILRNHIHNNGSHAYLDHGIYVDSGSYDLIAANVIDHNFAFGVQLYPNADNAIVTENTIVANGKAGVIVSGDSSTTSGGNVIVNNVLAFNGEEGVRTGSTGLATSNNVANNNLLYGNNTSGHGAGNVWIPIPSLTVTGSRVVDPLFVSPSAGDYRLGSGSPAQGVALPAYATSTDVTGVPRDAAPDLGAYEYTS